MAQASKLPSKVLGVTIVYAFAVNSGNFAVADNTLGNQFNGNGLRCNIVFFHLAIHIVVIYKFWRYSVGVIPYSFLNCSRKLAGVKPTASIITSTTCVESC